MFFKTKQKFSHPFKRIVQFLILTQTKKFSHPPNRTNFLLKEKLFILTRKIEKEKISYSY